ncbi:MAG: methionine--tRNA ligase [Candidatus Woesearchaeota archaeon]|nr:MAG: methionine--tRNA ligase [Candidatus Woesearchaeota archaeon]
MAKKKFYITTAIDYVNAPPHIGHAYEKVIADAIARWHRQKGEGVFFLTGTDENAQKNAKAAKEDGIGTQKFVNKNSQIFKQFCDTLKISYDDFIRTTEERHKKVSQLIFKKIYENEEIYLGNYSGIYCTGCEAFITEKELVNEKCLEHNIKPEKINEESFFFKLSAYQEDILDAVSKKSFIVPDNRREEIVSRVKQEGLKDLSVSRLNIDWGVPVPIDERHKIYVWLDALVNYISALGYPDDKKYKKYWPADVHVIGKGINWFHTVIWPALLMSAKIKLPKKVFVHGYLTVNGKKISKSLGNVIDPIKVSNKYGVDTLRYFLLREIPAQQDGDFNEKALVARLNGELADDLGNLLSRVVSMITKYFGGKVPNGKIDKELEYELSAQFEKADKFIENLEVDKAVESVWGFIKTCNRYVNDKKPWENENREDILYNLYEALRCIAILVNPFIPETSEKIAKQLGLNKVGDFKELKFKKTKAIVNKGEVLFQKVEWKK